MELHAKEDKETRQLKKRSEDRPKSFTIVVEDKVTGEILKSYQYKQVILSPGEADELHDLEGA